MQLDDGQVSTASGSLRQTRTAIESSFFFPWTVPEWNNLPGHLAVPTQLRLSGPNWYKRLALRPWSLVATTTAIEMTADPLCHISLMGVLHGTDLDLEPSIWVLKVVTTHADLVLDKKPRVKLAVVWPLITLFYRKKKHFFILNDNKDKKHIILPVQNLGGGGGGAFAFDASYGPDCYYYYWCCYRYC